MSPRKPILAAVAAGALALGAGAAASRGGSQPRARYTSGPLTASFSAPTLHPNCKQKWPVTVTATLNGKPAHATAFYQFLFKGTVESTQYPFSSTSKNPGPHPHIWSFTGSFTDNTFGPFGALAVGLPLTIRAVVKDGKYTAYPGLNISVVKVAGCKAVH